MVAWRRTLDQRWPAIRFGDVTVDTVGETHTIQVQVYSDDLILNDVRVELYAEAADGEPPVRQEMRRDRPVVDAAGFWLFRSRVPADRPVTDYTPRVIPQYPGVAIPLEDPRIVWQR